MPARSATIACCFLAKELNKADLPTFGRPNTATWIRSSASASLAFGMIPTSVSRSSPTPLDCVVLVRIIGLIPSRWKSSAAAFGRLSHLFTTKNTGLRVLSAIVATRRSSSVIGASASVTTQITSALSAACWICSWIVNSNSSSASLIPAVSISQNCCPWWSALAQMLSRVVPASWATIASRLSKIALNKEDLPTLALPTMATIGSFLLIYNIIS